MTGAAAKGKVAEIGRDNAWPTDMTVKDQVSGQRDGQGEGGQLTGVGVASLQDSSGQRQGSNIVVVLPLSWLLSKTAKPAVLS